LSLQRLKQTVHVVGFADKTTSKLLETSCYSFL